MKNTLWPEPETLWTALNGRWRLVKTHGWLMLECVPTGATDWPIRWPSGEIAYDRPEAIPMYVKNAIAPMI